MAVARMWNMRMFWVKCVAAPAYHTVSGQPHVVRYQADTTHRKMTFCSVSDSPGDINSTLDIQARTTKIVSDLHSKGITRCSEKATASIYELLLDLGIKSSTIEEQFLETPDILGYPTKNWRSTCEVLSEFGLSSHNILQNIVVCPQLLQTKPAKLRQNMLTFHAITIGKQNLLALVNKYPALYLHPLGGIKKRLRQLSSIFPASELKSLIKNNPNILVDSWDEIMEKILYIHEEMGLEQPHIAATKSLRRSMVHIKSRHQFLLRAGLYVKPNLLRDRSSYKRNPSLTDIMDTSNTYFANKVAKLTVLEYTVFRKTVEEESSSQVSDSEDSDDEEDTSHGYHSRFKSHR